MEASETDVNPPAGGEPSDQERIVSLEAKVAQLESEAAQDKVRIQELEDQVAKLQSESTPAPPVEPPPPVGESEELKRLRAELANAEGHLQADRQTLAEDENAVTRIQEEIQQAEQTP